ncbi:hypothetical protein ACEUA8_01395 [Aeromonas veronii]
MALIVNDQVIGQKNKVYNVSQLFDAIDPKGVLRQTSPSFDAYMRDDDQGLELSNQLNHDAGYIDIDPDDLDDDELYDCHSYNHVVAFYAGYGHWWACKELIIDYATTCPPVFCNAINKVFSDNNTDTKSDAYNTAVALIDGLKRQGLTSEQIAKIFGMI